MLKLIGCSTNEIEGGGGGCGNGKRKGKNETVTKQKRGWKQTQELERRGWQMTSQNKTNCFGERMLMIGKTHQWKSLIKSMGSGGHRGRTEQNRRHPLKKLTLNPRMPDASFTL